MGCDAVKMQIKCLGGGIQRFVNHALLCFCSVFVSLLQASDFHTFFQSPTESTQVNIGVHCQCLIGPQLDESTLCVLLRAVLPALSFECSSLKIKCITVRTCQCCASTPHLSKWTRSQQGAHRADTSSVCVSVCVYVCGNNTCV